MTDFSPAIAALEKKLSEAERKAQELRNAINILCVEAGLPARYPDQAPQVSGSSAVAQIKSDTFYGKKQQTAVREYLEMRKVQGLGPAKPRDIYEALRDGGYLFEAKDEGNALVGLRAVLRKNSSMFHKLPQGTYGLTAWYPNAKSQKQQVEHDLEGSEEG